MLYHHHKSITSSEQRKGRKTEAGEGSLRKEVRRGNGAAASEVNMATTKKRELEKEGKRPITSPKEGGGAVIVYVGAIGRGERKKRV